MNEYHMPVLVERVLWGLRVKSGEKYLDATLGGGGHTLEILKRGGIVLGIDLDEEALDFVKEKIKNQKSKIKNNLTLVQGNFKDIKKIAEQNGLTKVAGILFDLGVSSHQIDTSSRGFSLRFDAPLDMRMDKSLEVSSKDLVNGLSKKELTLLFRKYGEERNALKIAQKIVDYRKKRRIVSTHQLRDIVYSTNIYESGLGSATRVFQALRIAVNDELHSLEGALSDVIALLQDYGRIMVISFHSLEDRIVKHRFEEFAKQDMGEVITKTCIIPTKEESERNPRSRSAKMRIFEKK